jgi:hypothetical protein
MRALVPLVALVVILAGLPLERTGAQSAAASAGRADYEARLTVFRNPASGVEVRRNHLAIFVGFYPTILRRSDAESKHNTNWIRYGVTYYSHTTGPSVYATISGMWSLQNDWKNGVLWDAGVRYPFGDRVAGRLGVAALTTTDGLVRVNPTVGFDVPLKRWR